MQIQTINRGMANRAYQINNPTMPMAKTKNMNPSTVANNNITCSIYGKNSSRTVSFGMNFNPASITRLRKLAFIDGTLVFPNEKLQSLTGACEQLRKHEHPKKVLALIDQLIKATDKNAPLIFRDNLGNPNLVDCAITLDKSKSPIKVLSFIHKLSNLTMENDTPLFISNGNALCELAGDLANSKSPEKAIELLPKLFELNLIPAVSSNPFASKLRNIRYAALKLAESKSPKKAFEFLQKLDKLNQENARSLWGINEDAPRKYINTACKLGDSKATPEQVYELMEELEKVDCAYGGKLFTRNNRYIDRVVCRLANSESPEKTLKFIRKLSEIYGSDNTPMGEFLKPFFTSQDTFLDVAIKLGQSKSPEKVLEFIYKLSQKNSGLGYEHGYNQALSDISSGLGTCKSGIDICDRIKSEIQIKRDENLSYNKGYSVALRNLLDELFEVRAPKKAEEIISKMYIKIPATKDIYGEDKAIFDLAFKLAECKVPDKAFEKFNEFAKFTDLSNEEILKLLTKYDGSVSSDDRLYEYLFQHIAKKSSN